MRELCGCNILPAGQESVLHVVNVQFIGFEHGCNIEKRIPEVLYVRYLQLILGSACENEKKAFIFPYSENKCFLFSSLCSFSHASYSWLIHQRRAYSASFFWRGS